MRTMARGTSGTVRELALLDGVTHSARSPVCLIKHHAGCWDVRVLVTERAVCVAVVVVRAAGQPPSPIEMGLSDLSLGPAHF